MYFVKRGHKLQRITFSFSLRNDISSADISFDKSYPNTTEFSILI